MIKNARKIIIKIYTHKYIKIGARFFIFSASVLGLCSLINKIINGGAVFRGSAWLFGCVLWALDRYIKRARVIEA